MAMTIVNQSQTDVTYTLFAGSSSGGSVGSGAPGSGTKGGSRGSGTTEGSRGSGSPKGSASGVASSGVKASGSDSYTVAHDWMQAPGHNLSVSGG
jgi:hypothetical protein